MRELTLCGLDKSYEKLKSIVTDDEMNEIKKHLEDCSWEFDEVIDFELDENDLEWQSDDEKDLVVKEYVDQSIGCCCDDYYGSIVLVLKRDNIKLNFDYSC